MATDKPVTSGPTNNELQATQLLGQIPLGAIIGSPLKAAVEAQSAAAMACYKFITNVGFEPQSPPPTAAANGTPSADINKGKIRTITFIYERTQAPAATPPATTPTTVTTTGATAGTSTGTSATTTSNNSTPITITVSITVPLLTIMPLPFIRIESMTINFKASISASDDRGQSDTSDTTADLKADATLGFGWWKVNAGGSISSKKDSTATSTSKYSVEHTMDISVHAVQDDMPAGLAKILSLLTDSITVNRA